MKTKIFYPYIIIEFILCMLSYVVSVKDFGVSIELINLIAVSINIPFLLTIYTRNKKDKLFGLIFSSLMTIGAIVNICTNNMAIVFTIYAVAIFAIIFRTATEEDKLFKAVFSFFPIVLIGIIFLLILKIVSFYYFSVILLGFMLILGFVLMSIMYYKSDAKEKQNYLMGFAGLFIFICWLAGDVLINVFDKTATIQNLLSLVDRMMFIPSIWLTTLTFISFQPHAA